jgi:hypothetical protein
MASPERDRVKPPREVGDFPSEFGSFDCLAAMLGDSHRILDLERFAAHAPLTR